jgi:hypothetical protein
MPPVVLVAIPVVVPGAVVPEAPSRVTGAEDSLEQPAATTSARTVHFSHRMNPRVFAIFIKFFQARGAAINGARGDE